MLFMLLRSGLENSWLGILLECCTWILFLIGNLKWEVTLVWEQICQKSDVKVLKVKNERDYWKNMLAWSENKFARKVMLLYKNKSSVEKKKFHEKVYYKRVEIQ